MRAFKKAIICAMIFMIALLPCSVTAFAVSTETMVSKLLSVAENEVGYSSSGSYSKYGEWYGYQGGWCTTFAIWCFNKTGESLGVKLYANIVPSGGNCNSMISWFTNKGRYHKRSSGYTPKRGDLIFFDWSGNGSAQHVGIVKSVSGSNVYTIEGNCSGKVKEKSYSPSGSKPYASTSSILGYGNPDWGSVGSGGQPKAAATKAPTTKATTQKTTKKSTTEKASEKTTEKSTTTTKPTTTTTTTKPAVKAKDMKIHAATNTLQVGDSVKLDYEIKPLDSSAVVGYFCDEENIITISDTGLITATGEGKATVVVCANDEIYRQCDFTVTAVNSQVTTQSPDTFSTIPYIGADVTKSNSQKLGEIGINVERLLSHKNYYVIPCCILGTTGVVTLCILGVKSLSEFLKGRKKEEEND